MWPPESRVPCYIKPVLPPSGLAGQCDRQTWPVSTVLLLSRFWGLCLWLDKPWDLTQQSVTLSPCTRSLSQQLAVILCAQTNRKCLWHLPLPLGPSELRVRCPHWLPFWPCSYLQGPTTQARPISLLATSPISGPVGLQSCMSLLYTNTQQFPRVPKSLRPWRPSSTLDIPPLNLNSSF